MVRDNQQYKCGAFLDCFSINLLFFILKSIKTYICTALAYKRGSLFNIEKKILLSIQLVDFICNLKMRALLNFRAHSSMIRWLAGELQAVA